ncbi:MAG: threonine synthase [Pseudomonadota bacterium]
MIGYISTRERAPRLKFSEATLAGLAEDGGLYVPESFPKLSAGDVASMAHQPYLEAAWRVILPFVGDDIPSAELIRLLRAAYKNFGHPDIAPLRRFEDNFYVLELFHGPTLAFKDVALQFLGQVFGHILSRNKQKVTIIGATSGDTGSAAIEAFKGMENVNVFILHPHNRVSEVQRRQMTTVEASNIFNVAVEGCFDDCQDLVKAMFNDRKFRDEMRLSAVNSINWARILAQVVYYAFAGARVHSLTGKPVTFCVPTGNFGNVYAGYVARMMGAPIEKLVVATNRNDILHRFFETGEMKGEGVTPSLSPSMDIRISSNFERLLFDQCGRDGGVVEQALKQFREAGAFRPAPDVMARLKGIFSSGRQDDAETLRVIERVYRQRKYILDPHTAVGVGVAESYQRGNPDSVIVSIATAHPAKFPEAVKKATGIEPELPPQLADLYQRFEKYDVLPVSLPRIQQFVRERAWL